MADYWAKIYIEVLDDPKMATLPDRLWRRIIEIILCAKRLGKGGHLPDTAQLAWMLRMNAEALELDLLEIEKTGIVISEDIGWFLPQFEKRQGAVSSTERVQQFRKRQQKQQYNGDETNMKRIVTQNTETETETETEGSGDGDIFKAYEQNIGHLTPIISDDLQDLETDYSKEWILEAIDIAVGAEKRSLNYVRGILKKWHANGKSQAKGEYIRPASEVY